MRTTITLDDDIAEKLRVRARRTGLPFKAVVNEALRAGLALTSPQKRRPPFTIAVDHLMHLRTGGTYDKVEDLFDRLDGENRAR